MAKSENVLPHKMVNRDRSCSDNKYLFLASKSSLISLTAGTLFIIFPLCFKINEISKLAKAILLNTSSICKNSVLSVRKNFCLAGVLKNKSRTSILVPASAEAGCIVTAMSLPSLTACHAYSSLCVRDVKVNLETELMLASASPRKPRE